MSILAAAIIAALLILLAAAVAVAYQQADTIRLLRHDLVQHTETIRHLEQKLKPFEWRIPDTEMQTTVTRGRTRVARRGATVPPGSVLIMPDIDDIPMLKGTD